MKHLNALDLATVAGVIPSYTAGVELKRVGHRLCSQIVEAWSPARAGVELKLACDLRDRSLGDRDPWLSAGVKLEIEPESLRGDSPPGYPRLHAGVALKSDIA